MLRLDAGDLADGGEDMRTVHGGALDAVAVVDAATARLLVDVELPRRNTNTHHDHHNEVS